MPSGYCRAKHSPPSDLRQFSVFHPVDTVRQVQNPLIVGDHDGCPVPAVGMLNIAMREAGALGGAMSGSGTAVFGIFSNRQAACAAKEQLAPRFAGCRFFVTEPKQSGIVFA